MSYPQNVDLSCYRGQTWKRNIYVTDSDGEIVDLTGMTVKAQIRKDFNSATLIQEITCTVTAAQGKVALSIAAGDTVNIQPGRYVFDVKFTDGNDEVQYYICGNFIVRGRVTE